MAENDGRIEGKRIVLGVTGGIAAYKSLDVVGRLRDEGADVRVVMTRAATSLIAPLTFQARSGNPVFTDMWTPAQAAPIEHIEYARWADLLLVAPLTANTMARFAHGLAEDPLSTLYLAFDGPVLVAPAMNTVMYEHAATVANMKALSERGVEFIEPQSGKLACGEIGAGKMAAVESIVEAVVAILTRTRELEGCHALITAGPTRERLDPARFISNPSSGKMGYALAAEAARRGAAVTLVSGPVTLSPPRGVQVVPVVSAQEMFEAVCERQDQADMLIFCAAVADFAPAEVSREKVKKTGGETVLRLKPTPDIAFETSKQARARQLRIGFAAETSDIEANAAEKLIRKKLDFIVANDISQPDAGFGADDNRATLIAADGARTAFDLMPKSALARRLFDVFAEAWRRKQQTR